jgi:hypothetical protein
MPEVIINRLLLARITTTVNGRKKTITVLEAIMTQLFQKVIAGDARAFKTLQRYRHIVARDVGMQLEVSFVEHGGIQMPASRERERGDD